MKFLPNSLSWIVRGAAVPSKMVTSDVVVELDAPTKRVVLS